MLYSVQFKSAADGQWIEVRGAFYRFFCHAADRMVRLRKANPDMRFSLRMQGCSPGHAIPDLLITVPPAQAGASHRLNTHRIQPSKRRSTCRYP